MLDLRKTKSMEELIPWLYLKGISTGDFSEALADMEMLIELERQRRNISLDEEA
jgi:hypothetical protein